VETVNNGQEWYPGGSFSVGRWKERRFKGAVIGRMYKASRHVRSRRGGRTVSLWHHSTTPEKGRPEEADNRHPGGTPIQPTCLEGIHKQDGKGGRWADCKKLATGKE